MTATLGRMPNMEKTPRRTIRVDDELWEAAQAAADADGKTVSDVIREALTRYVKKNGAKPSAHQLRAAAADAAWEASGSPRRSGKN